MTQRLKQRLKAFWRNSSGTAALEFALIALPFFTLLLGTIEVGLLTLKISILEGATREAARQIRTGAVQTNANPIGLFQQTLCAGLLNLYDCNSFYVDVRTFSDFTTISIPTPLFDANGNPTNLVFQPGGAGTVETARVVHNHQFITPLIGQLMGSGASNGLTILSTAVFKTEPYQ